jgi:hypothetical protein
MNCFLVSVSLSNTIITRAPSVPAQNFNVTTARTFFVGKSYALNNGWVIIFVFGNVVMLAAALAALVFKLKCCGPDILGFASSLVRDSPYFTDADKAESTVDGPQRTRKMRRQMVRVGDVRVGEEFGRIAFAPLIASGRTIPGRLYE